MTYVYDALKRLKQAYTADSTWGLEFTYDEFGNRVSQSQMPGKGGTEHEATVDAATNRMTESGGLAVTYDASGNITAAGVQEVDDGGVHVDERTGVDQFLRGGREPIGDVPAVCGCGNEVHVFREEAGASWHFRDTVVFEDRLGSVVWQGPNGKKGYYPYGEEQGTNPTLERDTFGTYFRDEVTNLDYAQQRYYSSTVGRFLSADPYVAPSAVREPQAWNRYGYVTGVIGNITSSRVPGAALPSLGICENRISKEPSAARRCKTLSQTARATQQSNATVFSNRQARLLQAWRQRCLCDA